MADDANRNVFQVLQQQIEDDDYVFTDLQPVQPFLFTHPQDESNTTPTAEMRPSGDGTASHGNSSNCFLIEPSTSEIDLETSFDILVQNINELNDADDNDDGNDHVLIDDASSEGDDVASILDDSDPELEIEEDLDEDIDGTLQTTLPTGAVGTLTSKDGTVWSEEPVIQSFRQRQCNVFRPVKSHVKNVNIRSITDTLSVFSLFFTAITISNIVKFTNLEGVRCKGNSWVNTDEVEMMALFGLYYHLGARKLNLVNVIRIWTGIAADPVARATMTMKRFMNLTNCLRFDNKETRSARREKDIFAPIRDLFDAINNRLANYYIPDMNMTVDEQLIPWRGRVKFLQFLPSKPDKYGLKLFWICDSTTAYPLKGIPYLGKYGERRTNLGRETVKELAVPYLKTGRNITFDNFFTDKDLVLWLAKQGLSGVGTVRRDKRFLPEKFKNGKDLRKYESQFAFTSEMAMVSHKSNHKKNVIILSSMHNTKHIDEGPKRKPEIVKYYNETKGAVDTFDQMCHSLTTKRKCRRWPMVIFYNLLDTVAISSNIIYREIFPNDNLSKVRKRPEFQEDLAKCLLQEHLHRRLGKLRKPNILLELSIQHVCEVWKIQRPTQSNQVREAVTSSSTSNRKRHASQGRCLDCPRKKDTKVRQVCSTCCRFICKEHAKTVCRTCSSSSVMSSQ